MFFNKKIITLLVATSIVSSTVTYILCKQNINILPKTSDGIISEEKVPQSLSCNYRIERIKGYKFIRPLAYAEPECEGSEYLSLKIQIQNVIENYKKSGNINSASVYLRDFNKGNWMCVNPDEKYHPASLLKLAVMMTLLKMDENNPGFLSSRLTFSQKLKETKIQTFNSKQIQIGKSYSVKELIQYMVSYSDNNATNLLHEVVDWYEYKKIFYSLDIPIPDVYKSGYTISAKDYSTLLKVLYNGGYLNFEHSEFAFELLVLTDFKNGFASGLPKGTPIAHKFGEWTDGNAIRQLHESGLIYLDGTAYLLTIMTSGKNVQTLTEVISNLTKNVYSMINKPEIPDVSYTPDSKNEQMF